MVLPQDTKNFGLKLKMETVAFLKTLSASVLFKLSSFHIF